jgi:hypothetical protein
MPPERGTRADGDRPRSGGGAGGGATLAFGQHADTGGLHEPARAMAGAGVPCLLITVLDRCLYSLAARATEDNVPQILAVGDPDTHSDPLRSRRSAVGGRCRACGGRGGRIVTCSRSSSSYTVRP